MACAREAKEAEWRELLEERGHKSALAQRDRAISQRREDNALILQELMAAKRGRKKR